MTKKRKAAARRAPSSPRSRSGAKAARAAVSIATNPKKSVSQRVAAMAKTSAAVCADDKSLQSMLTVLRDVQEPVDVRLRALQSLQGASFSVVAFESCRGDYIATLRAVAEDPDPEIRQRVLGLLAREKDGFAQRKLLEGLRDPQKALVPPEKALQLLSYDVHAEAYSAARAIVENPPNDSAKREALRLLAADTASTPVFEKILLDKKERPEIRQISAAALQALDPGKLRTYARDIVLDPGEGDEIQATSLTALTQFGEDKAMSGDEPLRKRVGEMRDKASAAVKQSARQFLTKYK